MKIYFVYPAMLTMLLTVCSCSQNQKNRNAATNGNAVQKKAIDTADTRLARDFSIFFITQVRSADIAVSKAQTKKVKDFASFTKNLYAQLGTKLNRIADDYQVELPAEITPTATAQIKDLQDIKGKSFDHIYLLQMLKQHNAMIREFNAAKNIQCVPLRMFSISNQGDVIKQAYATSALKDKTPD